MIVSATQTQDVQGGIPGRLNAIFIRWPLAFVGAMVLIYFGGHADYQAFARFAVDPFDTTLAINEQFLYSSPLNLWIRAALSHLVGHAMAYGLTALLAVLAVTRAWRLYAAGFNLADRAALLFIVFSTPILLVATKWVGKGDLFMVAAYLVILARGGTGVVCGAAACVIILAHREIGTLMLAGHCFLRRTTPMPVLLGAAAGLSLMLIYQHALLPPVAVTRVAIVLNQGGELLRRNAC
jgi:hypothetical protein